MVAALPVHPLSQFEGRPFHTDETGRMRLNKYQKRTLDFTVLTLIVISLFPPWRDSASRTAKRDYVGLAPVWRSDYQADGTMDINYKMLGAEWVIVLALSSIMLVRFSGDD